MLKLKQALTLTALLACSSAAMANVYVSGGAGMSAADDSPNLANANSSNQQYTYNANLGYQYNINKNFASGIEANYINYGQTDYSATNNSNNSGSFANSAIQILVTGTYLMDNGVNT